MQRTSSNRNRRIVNHAATHSEDSESSDEDLMLQLQRGDQAAFECLLSRHAQSIHAFIFRLCRNQADAEDLVQETFLKIWQRADQWQPGKVRLTTWLHRIARNLTIDGFRKSSRRPQSDFTIDPDQQTSSTDLPQEEALIHERRQAAVARSISDLPERQRTALILCQYQGMSNREAARVLEVSLDALESLLSRARRQLRQGLADHLEAFARQRYAAQGQLTSPLQGGCHEPR